MHLVFLTGGYVPRCGAVGQCVKNLVDCMSRTCTVTVICIRQYKSEQSIEEVDNHRIQRVSTPLINAYLWAESVIEDSPMLGRSGGHALKAACQIWRNIVLHVSRTASDSDIVDAFETALSHLDHAPDAIIATCSPFEGVIAASRFKQKNKETALLAFLFDQYAEAATVYKLKTIMSLKMKANIQEEQKTLSIYDALFHVTWNAHVDKYLPSLKEKFHQVEHPLLVAPLSDCDEGEAGLETEEDRRDCKRSLQFTYAGSLSQITPPHYVLTLIDQACQEEYKLTFYARGPMTKYVQSCAEKNNRIRVYDWLSPNCLTAALLKSTFLVSIGECEGRQISSKIFTYMCTGKPILHIYTADKDVNIPYLANYPLALALKASDEELEKNVERLKEWIGKVKKKKLSFEEVHELFRAYTPENIAENFLTVIEDVHQSARMQEND